MTLAAPPPAFARETHAPLASATRAGEKALDVRNVSKTFKPSLFRRLLRKPGVHALRGMDLAVYRGEIFGLLGPNGAGKSTLVKILLGLVRPSSLEGELLGAPVGRRETLARVGYLPEQHRFPAYLTGRQVVEFFSALTGLSRRERKSRAAALIDRVGMTEAADRRVNTYSKGMRQRIGLAQSLASAPDLIILDEPTDGVDPLARRDIRDVLVEARGAGASVFVNSHLLGELELICDRVAILVNGQVARQGTIDELALGSERYEIELAEVLTPQQLGQKLGIHWITLPPQPGDAPAPSVQAPPASAAGFPGAFAPHPHAPTLHYRAPGRMPPAPAGTLSPFAATGTLPANGGPIPLTFDPAIRTVRLETMDLAPATAVLDALRAAGVPIRRFTPVRPTLEDMFLSTIAAPGSVLR